MTRSQAPAAPSSRAGASPSREGSELRWRSIRAALALALCGLAQTYAWRTGLYGGRGLMDLHPVFSAGGSAMLLASSSLAPLCAFPSLRRIRPVDRALSAALFFGTWMSAVPIGFVLGDLARPWQALRFPACAR